MPVAPVGNLDAIDVRTALEAAFAAPSWHGRRPWRFECTPGSIQMIAETADSPRVADPLDRGVLLACGAALLNLRLAIRQAGVVPDVRVMPDPDRTDLVAIIGCTVLDGPMSAVEQQLAAAIWAGHPGPGPFLETPVPEVVKGRLRMAARVERAWCSEIGHGDLARVRDLPPAADALHQADSGFESDPLLMCFGTVTDRPADQVTAGQAAQRVTLTATTEGLTSSLLSGLVEVDATRLALRALIGGGIWPQLVVRSGYRPPSAKPLP